MSNIDELKKAILSTEKAAHMAERCEMASKKTPREREEWAWAANNLRIASACMWDKLERLEH